MTHAGDNLTCMQQQASLASTIGFILLEADGVPAMVTTIGAKTALARRRGLTAILNPAPAVDGVPAGMGGGLHPRSKPVGSRFAAADG
jgi:hypothetical protein